MTVDVVIARYNEDLSWVDNIREKYPEYNIIVYNKGSHIPNSIPLLNVGRESDTYLTHIINNYTNLANITIFLQGNPFDHISLDGLYELLDSKTETIFSPRYGKCNIDYNTHFYTRDRNRSKYAIGQWWNVVFNKPYPYELHVIWNALFTVNKTSILNNSLEFYKNALNTVNYVIDAEEAQYFERTWGNIFY
jgi:hypothetical protein